MSCYERYDCQIDWGKAPVVLQNESLYRNKWYSTSFFIHDLSVLIRFNTVLDNESSGQKKATITDLHLTTVTALLCPIRYARPTAWPSTARASSRVPWTVSASKQSESAKLQFQREIRGAPRRTTCDASIRFVPDALFSRESMITRTDEFSDLNLSMAWFRKLTFLE